MTYYYTHVIPGDCINKQSDFVLTLILMKQATTTIDTIYTFKNQSFFFPI